MRIKIPLSSCIVGDTLASNVYDEDGTLLLKKRAILTQEHKIMLSGLGISELTIDFSIINVGDFEELHTAVIGNVKQSIGNLLFQNGMYYTKVIEYLVKMYESIHDKELIIKTLYRIKNIDDYTFNHSIQTALYAMMIAIWMGLDEESIIHATQAGILHDIGKIFIPVAILNKPSSLTSEEFDFMKKHTIFGYSLVNEFTEVDLVVKRAVLFHHERNGSQGYPLSASWEAIGIITKIVAVADVYDAMTTDRVYKKALSQDEVIAYLKQEGMKILDNDVLDVFLKNIPLNDFKELSRASQSKNGC